MATLIVKHRVAHFESWKSVFESMTPARAKFGWISHRVLRDTVDPNLVTIISRVEDLDRAKQFGASAEARDAMQRAGVQGPPDVQFLDDQVDHTY